MKISKLINYATTMCQNCQGITIATNCSKPIIECLIAANFFKTSSMVCFGSNKLMGTTNSQKHIDHNGFLWVVYLTNMQRWTPFSLAILLQYLALTDRTLNKEYGISAILAKFIWEHMEIVGQVSWGTIQSYNVNGWEHY